MGVIIEKSEGGQGGFQVRSSRLCSPALPPPSPNSPGCYIHTQDSHGQEIQHPLTLTPEEKTVHRMDSCAQESPLLL